MRSNSFFKCYRLSVLIRQAHCISFISTIKFNASISGISDCCAFPLNIRQINPFLKHDFKCLFRFTVSCSNHDLYCLCIFVNRITCIDTARSSCRFLSFYFHSYVRSCVLGSHVKSDIIFCHKSR